MKRIILTATLILLSLFIFSQNTNQTDKKTSVDKNTKTRLVNIKLRLH